MGGRDDYKKMRIGGRGECKKMGMGGSKIKRWEGGEKTDIKR